MALVTFKKSGTAKSIRGNVGLKDSADSKKLTFNKDGVAKMELAPGTYTMGCVASGKKDATFKLAVTSPAASRCDIRGALPSSGFDFGAVEFDVL